MESTVELFTARSGVPSARVRLANGTTRHLHSTIDPHVEGSYYPDLTLWGDTIVLVGTGLGHHVAALLPTVSKNSRIIFIDYYEECIAFCKEAFENLFGTRSLFVSQKSLYSDSLSIQNFIARQSIGSLQVIRHPASFGLQQEFYNRILDTIQPRAHAAVHASVPSGKKKKVLLFSGEFFLQRECASALQQANVDAILFLYENFKSSNAYEQQLQKIIELEKPDCILSINMKGFDPNGALGSIAGRRNIPVAIWFVDDPHPILLHQKQFVTPDMYAFCWEESFLPYLVRCGFKQTQWLPLATDHSLFQNIPAQSQKTVPLSFVGSAMAENYLGTIKEKFMWNPSLKPFVEMAAQILLDQPALPHTQLLKQASATTGMPLPFRDERNTTWLLSLISVRPKTT